MIIYNNLYWLIISPKELFRAWDVFKRDKRNKPDVAEFELNLEQNIFDLYRDLRSGIYRHGHYKGFWIHDPKLRRIHKATVRDRILHHSLFAVINLIFEPAFIPTSFSCRIGKGTHKGVRWVERTVRAVSRNYTQPCYALKCDVRKFFDSMDHQILLGILRRKIKDKQVLDLLHEVVESFETSRTNLFEARGVPIGNLTSQVFANIYMNEFDHFVKQELKIKNYARYTDDFVIISNDKNYLASLVEPMRTFLKNRLHLDLHPAKTILRNVNRGVDFLGYIILPHHIQLRSKTKRIIPRRLRQSVKWFKVGKVSELTLKSSLFSYLGVRSHATAYQLSKEMRNNFWFWLSE